MSLGTPHSNCSRVSVNNLMLSTLLIAPVAVGERELSGAQSLRGVRCEKSILVRISRYLCVLGPDSVLPAMLLRAESAAPPPTALARLLT